MIVVDASVLSAALGDDDADGDRARARLRGEQLAAPELIDLDLASVFRRLATAGRLDDRRARLAMNYLAAVPIRRARHTPLLPRCFLAAGSCATT